ncbi:glycosyltransferase family 1 protein [Ferrimicrobium sp.]|uniref:glycosyltransferase family 4 protein n=1 Tax=Ferrimicrobium sp. TaxID=2926050 RepID=UPI0026189136|nr:glycosyltransferase family 1 protein [Ferrimicrobium sp.]
MGEFAYRMAEAVASHVDATGFMVSLRRHGQLRQALPAGVDYLNLPLPARPLLASWQRWYRPDLRDLFHGFDVIHGTNFVVPPARGKATVVTVHDLTPLLYPRLCRPEVLAFPTLVRHAVQAGSFVHTPSEFIRGQVIDYFGVEPDRVVAIAHGITPLQARPSLPPIAHQLGGRPYILAMSTLEPRKGLNYLVQAFADLTARYPDLRLVLTGQYGWGFDELLASVHTPALTHRILLPGYVTEDTRSWLLRNALLFAYPSLYEGFGLPLLEAMSVGTPVVTTTAGAIVEVVGDAAITVAPRSADELVTALTAVIEKDELRGELIARGRKRAALFSWHRSGEQMAALYAKAAR